MKTPGAGAQLIILYNGSVNVYDEVAPDKAQAIMLMAATTATRADPYPVMRPLRLQLGTSGAASPLSAQLLAKPNSINRLPDCEEEYQIFPSTQQVLSEKNYRAHPLQAARALSFQRFLEAQRGSRRDPLHRPTPNRSLLSSYCDIPDSKSHLQSLISPPRQHTSLTSWSVMQRFLCIGLFIAFSISIATSAAHQSIILPGEEWGEKKRIRDSVFGDNCLLSNPSLYYQPVIGIVSHPGDGASGRLSKLSDTSNIPASYVKFVESAGARVIPIIYNEPWDVISEKLKLVNGVLFTGGWAKKGLYFEIIKRVFAFTLERNDDGDTFPLFAICLGFQLISMIISQDYTICEPFMAQNQASTLKFENILDIQGSVFERFPSELLKKLSSVCLCMQNHKYGVSPRRLLLNDALSNFLEILTTSIDDNNEVYISTAKAYKYPITCFQWHPEKNAFEWGLSAIPHSEDAIRVTQLIANYFISQARKSLNRAPAQRVRDNLIYNYSPIYGGKAGQGYDQVYNFHESG